MLGAPRSAELPEVGVLVEAPERTRVRVRMLMQGRLQRQARQQMQGRVAAPAKTRLTVWRGREEPGASPAAEAMASAPAHASILVRPLQRWRYGRPRGRSIADKCREPKRRPGEGLRARLRGRGAAMPQQAIPPASQGPPGERTMRPQAKIA